MADTALRVAVCLVGQLRSIEHTAHSLQKNLLDQLHADAFVVGLTDGPPSAADLWKVGQLGSRVVNSSSVVGQAHHLLDEESMRQFRNASVLKTMWLVHEQPRVPWPSMVAQQFLTRKRCRDLVLAHERAGGTCAGLEPVIPAAALSCADLR